MGRILRHGILLLGLCGACGGETMTEVAPAKVTTDSGSPVPTTWARGIVRLREGDCMPATSPERCHEGPLSTRVVAYDVLRVTYSSQGTAFPDPSMGTQRAVATSAEDGSFELQLPPGRYTILAEYEGEWWPHSWTSNDDAWAAVEVKADGTSRVELLINRATD